MTAPAPERTVVHDGRIDASPPPRADLDQLRLVGSRVLLALSLVLAWFLVYLLVLSSFEQGHAQNGLYGELRTQLAAGTAPTGAPVRAGAPVALLAIPGAGLEGEVVVEGSSAAQLQHGPGHVTGSVLPGQQGVSVVAGRSTSFGAPFARIAQLQRGDSVIATTAQGRFVYKVASVRQDGDPLPVAPAAGASRLTLVTAVGGGGLLGGLQPDSTVYVDAVLSDGAVAAGPRAAVAGKVELLAPRVGTTDLAFLALALQLLIAVLAATVYAWRRWSPAGAWIAGTPAVLAALWLASSIVSRFLPPLV